MEKPKPKELIKFEDMSVQPSKFSCKYWDLPYELCYWSKMVVAVIVVGLIVIYGLEYYCNTIGPANDFGRDVCNLNQKIWYYGKQGVSMIPFP